MKTTVLGTHKEKFLFTCQRAIRPREMRRLAARFILAAGMTPARRGRIDAYPYEPNFWKRMWNRLCMRVLGGGGFGWTGFFPLMESFLMVDVYTDLHQTEFLLSTCKPERIDMQALIDFLMENAGPTRGERLKPWEF